MVLDSKYWEDFCRKTGMPLDQTNLQHAIFNDGATFEYRYCFWPRRCYNTGRWLWLETAMHGRREYWGPAGEAPLVEHRWYDSNEALIMIIKKVSE